MNQNICDGPSPSDAGVLYVAIGWKMRRPLVRSIESVRQHLNLPITVITDLDGIENVDSIKKVKWDQKPSYAVKPAFIPQLPYHRTIVLDTDTIVMHPDAAAPLDLITPRYGYCAAAVHGLSRRIRKVDALPCTPSCNSGVLFLRRSPEVTRAMQLWREYYPGQGSEEFYLTRALLNAAVPTYWLTHEWNHRRAEYNPKSGVRIWHPQRTRKG